MVRASVAHDVGLTRFCSVSPRPAKTGVPQPNRRPMMTGVVSTETSNGTPALGVAAWSGALRSAPLTQRSAPSSFACRSTEGEAMPPLTTR